MRAFGRIISIAAVLVSVAGMAAAADIRVLSVGAVQNAVRPLAVDFSKETGHKIVFTVGSPAVVAQKLKDGETFDAVIVSEPAMDALDKEGIVNPESRVRLANTGIAVAVRAGAPVPNLSTPEAFKEALLAAKSLVYGDPTLRNQSGEKAEQILAKAGLLDALKGKLRVVPGQAESQDLIAKGEVEMGLYNLSEIPESKGLKIAGPVPAPLQLTTTYEGALMSDGSVPQAAREFIRFLSEPDARAKWLAAKLEPLADH
ncbi:MAG TPA: substrate-binding domain-containing protein [Xanthobacteraceae bacterium]|jgi:molybdate transport system substrate-binding protein|nr:substrate-binding domain-containing protein [Xanthobacteraceae bacterium]